MSDHKLQLAYHGVAVRVSADEAWPIEALAATLEPLHADPASVAARGVAIHLEVRGALGPLPEGVVHRFDHFSTRCYGSDGRLYILDRHVVAEIDEGAVSARVSVSPAARSEPWGLSGAAIVVLIELLRRIDLYQLHAGCLVRDDRCVLFTGPSGSGKTTATTALVAAGWRYLTDDLLFLRMEGDRVIALSWGERFNLSSRSARAFGIEPEIGRQRHDGRFEIDIDAALGARRVETAAPKTLILTSIVDEDSSRLEPLHPAHALAALVQQSPLVLVSGSRSEEHLAVLRRLAEQTDAFRLHAGRDVLAGALPGLVEEIARPAP